MKGYREIRSLLVLVLGLSAASGVRAEAGGLEQATDSWDGQLAKHVHEHGGVDYAGFERDVGPLKAFIAAYATASLKDAPDAVKKAAYINLYNAGMIFQVLNYARERKMVVGGDEFLALKIDALKVPGGNLWTSEQTFNLAGEQVTLDDIEHRLLRGVEPGPKLAPLQVAQLDPRLHAAVNCAAFSCPRLRPSAYRAATIEATLQQAMQEFISDDAQVHRASEDQLKLNSIVLWYYSDFDDYGKKHGMAGAGDYLADFVLKTAVEPGWKRTFLRAKLNDRSRVGLKLTSALDFFYNWQVNDTRNKP